MIFNNASVLSYNHKPIFLGGDIFNYSIEKELTINGYLLDLGNYDGVSGVLSGLNSIKQLAKNAEEIFLNGNSLGSGYIKNIKVNGDPDNDPNWVRYANYEAQLLILSTGSLIDATGAYYNLDPSVFNVKNLYLINKFDEDFSINLGKDGIYEYSHECKFSFENGLIKKNQAINIAKTLASGIILKEIPLELTEQYASNFLSGRRIYKESYDIINNSFSFSEEFAKSKSGDFADALYNYDVELNERGLVSVIENIKIKSLESPIFGKSIDKLSAIKGNSYNRCQNVYSFYFGNTGSLNVNSITQGINVNKFNGEIEYQAAFSNDPFIESGYEWEFVYDVKDDPQDIFTTLNLTINGHGPKNSPLKWNNAIYGFNQKKYLLDSSLVRNSGYAALKEMEKCGRPLSISYFLNNQRVESSYYDGLVNYTKIYSSIDQSTVENIAIQKSVNQYSYYSSINRIINHPQKSLGKYAVTQQIFSEINNLSIPSHSTLSGPYGGILEQASTTHKIPNNIIEKKVSYITHE